MLFLKDLIEILESQPHPDNEVIYGFGKPHSWRGDYSELAFYPAKDVTIGSMLEHAKSALGSTYRGYKGGEYRMGEYSECHIANMSETGTPLSEALMGFILDDENLIRKGWGLPE